ncbi:MAG: TIGR03619 family F420-dependent LLM class oxidoreductase [Pseudomonadota bacterium]|nr:TIGR03619 family F420-dependent LLM class oxidoreductase [Pseudomonadota bacterium]
MKVGVSLPVRELKNDLETIKAFAVLAEEFGYSHLRIPDQVIRPNNNHLHEPMTLLSYIAALTSRIELVPSVIVLPLRKTIEFARQATGVDILSGGRLRLGIGVGSSQDEYRFMGVSFGQRGAFCNEQMALLRQLWKKENVTFKGKWHHVNQAGINPLPIQKPIPMWIGGQASPRSSVLKRIATLADGWFVLATPEEFDLINEDIKKEADKIGRDFRSIGTEAGVAVVGDRGKKWQSRVEGWQKKNLSHLCLRTLGGGLTAGEHLDKLEEVIKIVPSDS